MAYRIPSITRRSLLAAAPGLLAVRAARSAELDVAIVGAGLAGIAAARELERLGRSCIVLEAQERVGGRAWTDTRTLGLPVDRGVQWLDAAGANPLRSPAEMLGLRLVPDSDLPWLVENGGAAPTGARSALRDARGHLAAAVAAAPRGTAVAAAVADSAAGRLAATLDVAFASGVEPDAMDATDLAVRPSGNRRLVQPGMGTLTRLLAQDLLIGRGVEIREIELGSAGVVLSGPRGGLRVRAAIVTVPTGVLAAGAIAFRPALPASHRDAIADLPMGLVDKIVLRLRDRALADVRPGTRIVGTGKDGAAFSLLLRPFGDDVAYLFVGGDLARNLASAGADAATAYATARLRDAMGGGVLRGRRGALITNWSAEPFAKGSMSAAGPGRTAARTALTAPVAGRLFFAGEATSTGRPGQAAGAWESGTRAAVAVHEALGGVTAADPAP